MPTHPTALAAVAAAIGGVDANDPKAVEKFYGHDFPRLPEQSRESIAGFLIASVAAPSPDDLAALLRRHERLVARQRRTDAALARAELGVAAGKRLRASDPTSPTDVVGRTARSSAGKP